MPAPVLEKEIEKAVVDHAKATGWLAYKWTSPGNRGVPDRLFFIHGRCLCIEFKALYGKTTKLQEKHHRALRKHGIGCEVIDNVTEGRFLLDLVAQQWKVSDSETG